RDPRSAFGNSVPVHRIPADFRGRGICGFENCFSEENGIADVEFFKNGVATKLMKRVTRGAGANMPKVAEPPVVTTEKKGNETEELRVIGVPRRRVDARAKVTGQTRFADDITLPRIAY